MPFRTFQQDHRRVLERLDTIEALMRAGGRRGRLAAHLEAALNELVRHLDVQFATHMVDEEEVLYPAVGEALPESIASLEPLRADHLELRTMLARLTQRLAEPPGEARDEQVLVQLRDFIDLLRIHIRKEEAAVFTVAARVLSRPEVDALAARVAERPRTHRSGAHRRDTKGNRP